METVEPNLEYCRNESALPRFAKSMIVMQEPILPNPRVDKEDPRCMQSTTDSLYTEPNVASVFTESAEPHRTYERTDSELPNAKQSRTDNRSPNLAHCLVLSDDPIWTKSRTDIAAPPVVAARNDRLEPRLA
jgi:hypothetical protein